jgi:hypothetical protein
LSPSCRQLYPLSAVFCVAVVSVLLMYRQVIHCLHYLSRLLLLLCPSFSEHRQVWSPWKHSPCPSDFGLRCTFFNNMELSKAAICSKNNVNFMVFLQDGQLCTIWPSTSMLYIN